MKSDDPIPLARTFSRQFGEDDLRAVFRAIVTASGHAGEVPRPLSEKVDLPTDSSYEHHVIETERWSCGGVMLTLVIDSQWHDKEGAGAKTRATFAFPGGAEIVVEQWCGRLERSGPADAAREAERVFVAAVTALGWGAR